MIDFLKDLHFQTEESAIWGDIELRIRAYQTDVFPPAQFVTSVRCLLRQDEHIFVMHNHDGTVHIMPGGRVEGNESYLETLNREILEETSWTIQTPTYLGFLHFQHQTPKPANYPYPYPDFLQLMYVAQVDSHHPEQKIEDDYEASGAFQPIQMAKTLPLSAQEQHFLSVVASL